MLYKGNTYSQNVWSLFAQAVGDRLAYKLYKTSIYKFKDVFERNGMQTAADGIWSNEECFNHLYIYSDICFGGGEEAVKAGITAELSCTTWLFLCVGYRQCATGRY